jgi:hypothetical protein
MPKNYNDRTLPYFFKNDDSAEARGFIEGSFLNGLNLSEFIFHHVTGREGLIDQALKTASSGYLQRKFIKAAEDFMVKYDGTVRNAVERIQQFIYGDSGIDTVKQYDFKFKIMEMNNAEIADKFKFTKEELAKLKNYSEKEYSTPKPLAICIDFARFGAKWQQEQIGKLRDELYNQLRDELYNQLPTGEINAFDLLKIINNHIKNLDKII